MQQCDRENSVSKNTVSKKDNRQTADAWGIFISLAISLFVVFYMHLSICTVRIQRNSGLIFPRY